ncbi:hypothetical protein DXG01_005789 [Tephrocybe rancida]|nr:hypothetical protein DXG01_005789 [Tephrocybe rancida]
MADSNRNSSYMQSSDAMRRSMTRNSHYSHVSTHSWVINNQQNPPPPPEDYEPLPSPVRSPRPLPDPLPSPARTPRPLPDPQLQPLHHPQQPQVLRTTNGTPPDDEEEYMNIDPNFPGMETGYLTEGVGRGRSTRPTPMSPSTAEGSGRGRTFVGGFVDGLRRLPRVVLKYRSFGEKRKYFRRATLGSGGTVTNGTDMTTGNTLPLYVSNPPTPVAGPSNSRYIESLEMPVPHPAEEPPSRILGPSLSQRRRHPSFRVTPPSEEVTGHELAAESPLDFEQPSQITSGPPIRNSNVVTIFDLPGQEDYPSEDPPMPLPVPTPNRRSESQHQPSPPASIPAETLPQSPVLAHPPPASDYRKMTLTSSPRSPRTLTTSLSSEPSFSSELSPVKNFFVKLYHLPWIAHERVTADYRPKGHGRPRGSAHGLKKPMSSWYRGKPGLVLALKGGSGDLDLLSSGNGSRRTSGAVPSPARHRSPDQRRPRNREHHRHTQSTDNPNRSHEHQSRHRRNTTSTAEAQQLNMTNGSPVIPAVYPYPYPYPFPYPSYPAPPPQRAQSQSTPRGPRPHRTPTYPHGYAPYQPPQPPPPVFVMHSPAQTSSSGGASHVYLPMQLVPGAFTQEPVHETPPASPGAGAGAGEAVAAGEA